MRLGIDCRIRAMIMKEIEDPFETLNERESFVDNGPFRWWPQQWSFNISVVLEGLPRSNPTAATDIELSELERLADFIS
jgi:hypothetical protein